MLALTAAIAVTFTATPNEFREVGRQLIHEVECRSVFFPTDSPIAGRTPQEVVEIELDLRPLTFYVCGAYAAFVSPETYPEGPPAECGVELLCGRSGYSNALWAYCRPNGQCWFR